MDALNYEEFLAKKAYRIEAVGCEVDGTQDRLRQREHSEKT